MQGKVVLKIFSQPRMGASFFRAPVKICTHAIADENHDFIALSAHRLQQRRKRMVIHAGRSSLTADGRPAGGKADIYAADRRTGERRSSRASRSPGRRRRRYRHSSPAPAGQRAQGQRYRRRHPMFAIRVSQAAMSVCVVA